MNPILPFFRGTGTVFPSQDLLSFDDEQVKEIALRLGIEEIFHPPTPGKMITGYTDDRHPTHRLFFARWTGQENPGDNGFIMMGWERRKHSFEEVEKFVTEFLKENVDGPVTVRNRGP